jgi:hypothetical protein
MCACVYVCVCVYIYIHVYMYICICHCTESTHGLRLIVHRDYVFPWTSLVALSSQVAFRKHLGQVVHRDSVHMHVCMHVYYTYICIYIYIYIYIYDILH